MESIQSAKRARTVANASRVGPSARMPLAWKRPSASRTNRAGAGNTADSVAASICRSAPCARRVPHRPPEAPMTATGLPASTSSGLGRESQSMAFLRTPGTDQLYSGVAIRSASAAATSSRRCRTVSGPPPVALSRSSSKRGIVPRASYTLSRIRGGAHSAAASSSRRLSELRRRLPAMPRTRHTLTPASWADTWGTQRS
jgi:hypothetical protein